VDVTDAKRALTTKEIYRISLKTRTKAVGTRTDAEAGTDTATEPANATETAEGRIKALSGAYRWSKTPLIRVRSLTGMRVSTKIHR
jgi:hypothetical protein|tara:strand:+ start:191 stop:448 length:258 start_codon:yes stop_codon:yes gene_type:complete